MSATKRTISFTVDVSPLAEVDRLSRKRSQSRSLVVSEALRDYVRLARQPAAADVYDRVRDDDEPVSEEDLRAIWDGRKDVTKGRTVRIEGLIEELNGRDHEPSLTASAMRQLVSEPTWRNDDRSTFVLVYVTLLEILLGGFPLCSLGGLLILAW